MSKKSKEVWKELRGTVLGVSVVANEVGHEVL
jgi:hypothetical protein